MFELEDAELRIGDRELLRDAELWLERGEHVSLIGPNGSGKTTLISALAGLRELDAGKLRRGHNVKLGVLSQHAEELDATANVLEAVQRATKLTPNKARALLGQFLFSGEAAEKPVEGLSGGERRRLSLAILVHSGANVLILDEPTNHLDLESREALEAALQGFQGAVHADLPRPRAARRGRLAHDRGRGRRAALLRRRLGRVPARPRGARPGRAHRQARAKPAKPRSEPAAAPAAAGPSKNQRRQAERLEQEIERAEAALKALEEELADPGAWSSPERSKQSTARHDAAKARARSSSTHAGRKRSACPAPRSRLGGVRAAPILAVLLATLSAAPAGAWEELPFRALPGGSPASCLRATGADGGLAALGPLEDLATPVDLLAAAAPPAVRARARFQIVINCPVLREHGGAAVAAVPDVGLSSPIAMAVAVRDAGGAFAKPARLSRATLTDGTYDAALSATGDAIVAWQQAAGARTRPRVRIVAARRRPGAAFGAAEALTPWIRSATVEPFLSVAAGIDGAGTATVAWTAPVSLRSEDVKVAVASAAPATAFGVPQVLTARADSLARISLAVAPDGGALLTHDGITLEPARLFERAAGAAAFGGRRELASAIPGTSAGTSNAVPALRDGGAAVVAWRDDGDDNAVVAMTRPPGGAFGPPRVVARDDLRAVELSETPAFSEQADLGLSLALSGDGRAALAWSAPRRLPDTPAAPVAASGTLAEGFGAAAVLGSPVRGIEGVTALVLAGGEPAVAWADNASAAIGLGDSTLESSLRDGRFHLARAGAAAAPPARPPAVRLRAPRVQRLGREEGVRLRVRCAAACDVRAYLRGTDGLAVGKGASLPAAGARDLRVEPAIGTLATRRLRRVVVRVRVAAPGSPVARTLRLPLRLIRRR